jgi:GTP cyclohydrolase IB
MLLPRGDAVNPSDQLLRPALEDVQAAPDDRGIEIDEAGVTGVPYPIELTLASGARQQTVAEVSMSARLEPTSRGVHMSRFVETLDANAADISQSSLSKIAEETLERLASQEARVSFRFPFFLRRCAPASGVSSLARYEGVLDARASTEGTATEVTTIVPVTSLCPCSKEISDYGAHNQRGELEVAVEGSIWLEELVDYAEAAGSAPLYPLLKRPDERQVTMQAYDKPAFVEDMVRDVILSLRDDPRVTSARVRARNQESIHVHDAVAQARWSRRDV